MTMLSVCARNVITAQLLRHVEAPSEGVSVRSSMRPVLRQLAKKTLHGAGTRIDERWDSNLYCVCLALGREKQAKEARGNTCFLANAAPKALKFSTSCFDSRKLDICASVVARAAGSSIKKSSSDGERPRAKRMRRALNGYFRTSKDNLLLLFWRFLVETSGTSDNGTKP